MNFLAPLAWLGALLAIPIIALYLVRERPRRLVVSNFMLWTSQQARLRESALWRKLRRPLSLLAQLVFLGLIVAALARPAFDALRQGAATVLVLDRSASMAAGDGRLEKARAALEAWGGESSVLATGPAPIVAMPWNDDPGDVENAVRKLGPTGTAFDPRPAIALAKSLAADRGGEVVFATDGVWDRAMPPDFLEGVSVVRVGAPLPNAGISMFSARRSAAAPGQIALAATLGRSPEGGGTARIELSEGGRVIDARDLPLTQEGWHNEWPALRTDSSEYVLKVDGYPNDALATDNQFAIRIPPLEPLDVMLVSEPEPFIERALASIPNLNVTRIRPRDAPRFGDPSMLWIFRGTLPPDDFQAAAMLLIAPPGSGFFGQREGDPDEVPFVNVDQANPLMRFVRLDQAGPVAAARFALPPSASVMAESTDRPLIFGNLAGERKYAVMAFDPAASDLVQRAAFPVLLANLAQGLRGDSDALFQAEGPNAAVTGLRSNLGEDHGNTPPHIRGGAWRPLWWWLVLAGICWALFEWWTYHRRLTE